MIRGNSKLIHSLTLLPPSKALWLFQYSSLSIYETYLFWGLLFLQFQRPVLILPRPPNIHSQPKGECTLMHSKTSLFDWVMILQFESINWYSTGPYCSTSLLKYAYLLWLIGRVLITTKAHLDQLLFGSTPELISHRLAFQCLHRSFIPMLA